MVNIPALFLDFDGVLHAFGEEAFNEDLKLIDNPRLFCWRSILEEALAPYPEVKIVVSSDWRRLFDDANLARLLGSNLGPRFLGVVECYKESRAEEILAEVARRKLSYWLAIDDHPSVFKAGKAGDSRFIACAPDTGLSEASAQRELRGKLSELVRRHGEEVSQKQRSFAEALMQMPNVGRDTDFLREQHTPRVAAKSRKKGRNEGSD